MRSLLPLSQLPFASEGQNQRLDNGVPQPEGYFWPHRGQLSGNWEQYVPIYESELRPLLESSSIGALVGLLIGSIVPGARSREQDGGYIAEQDESIFLCGPNDGLHLRGPERRRRL